MQIIGFNKTTLLDYPEHLAATVFLGGCNFRCPFCHNASLVLESQLQPALSQNEVIEALRKRRHILEGVCITGGEPTIHDALPDLIGEIKNLGYAVKLDTNGSNPDMLTFLINNHFIDYIAMDLKNSLDGYSLSIGCNNYNTTPLEKSVSVIMDSDLEYEFRTTVVKEHHTIESFHEIGRWIQGARAYFLQAFEESGQMIQKGLTGCSKDEMQAFAKILDPYVKYVSVRGINI